MPVVRPAKPHVESQRLNKTKLTSLWSLMSSLRDAKKGGDLRRDGEGHGGGEMPYSPVPGSRHLTDSGTIHFGREQKSQDDRQCALVLARKGLFCTGLKEKETCSVL